MRVSKRQKQINEKVESTKIYPILDALTLLKEIPNLKFNESIDISINLGVDPQKSDQNVRGSTSLPHGIGKQSKIAVLLRVPMQQQLRKQERMLLDLKT